MSSPANQSKISFEQTVPRQKSIECRNCWLNSVVQIILQFSPNYLIILIVCVIFFALMCRISISVLFKWHTTIEVHGLRWIFNVSTVSQFALDVFISTFLVFPNAIARTNAKLFNISSCIIVVVLWNKRKTITNRCDRFSNGLLWFDKVNKILLWDFPKCSFVVLFQHFWASFANSQTNYRSKNNIFRERKWIQFDISNQPEYMSVQFFVLTIFSLHDLDTDFLVVEPANLWAFVWFPVWKDVSTVYLVHLVQVSRIF